MIDRIPHSRLSRQVYHQRRPVFAEELIHQGFVRDRPPHKQMTGGSGLCRLADQPQAVFLQGPNVGDQIPVVFSVFTVVNIGDDRDADVIAYFSGRFLIETDRVMRPVVKRIPGHYDAADKRQYEQDAENPCARFQKSVFLLSCSSGFFYSICFHDRLGSRSR